MEISMQSVNLNVKSYDYSASYSVKNTTYTASANYTNVTNNVFINQEMPHICDCNCEQAPVTNNYFISIANPELAQGNIIPMQQPNLFNVSNNPIANLLNAIKMANQNQQKQKNINSFDSIINYLKTLVEYQKTINELNEVKKSLKEINKNKNKNWAEKTDEQREKDAPKLCNKLDKLGFKKELIDKLQEVLEKGNIEDLSKSKLKKFNKLMNKITKLANNNTRLTESKIQEYTKMIEEIVNMVEVDKEDEKKVA